jgi:phosphoribosylanthranilate isomerase
VTTDFKICGLTNRADAQLAAESGAGYLGAVLYPPSPRAVDAATARALSEGLEPDLVIVVAEESPGTVLSWARDAGADVIQLHGTETPDQVEAIRNAGDWRVWKAVRARDETAVFDAVARFAGVVDGLLVDGWHPERIGGTGVQAAWRDLTGLRERIDPGLLVAAGGLTPENVGSVIRLARPHVVDVSSGVERAPGRKDAAKIRAFAQAVKTA